MITRAIDSSHDFTFGNGKENYLSEQNALGQNIDTRVLSFVNDCFFAPTDGIDWFTYLGSKNQAGLKNAIAKIILNTTGVYSLDELSFTLSENRELLVQYQVTTIWGENLTSNVSVG